MKTRGDQSPMPESKRYQQLIGALLYLAVNTRPDISASVTILSQYNKEPGTADWNEAKRVARYLHGTKGAELRLGKRGGAPTLIGYADADYAETRLDRKSFSGYTFQYCGSTISWSCRKQSCVSQSSTEAEYIALAEATQEGIWIRRLLEDFEERPQEKTVIYEDNQSYLKLLDHKRFNHRTKHIDTKYHFVKDIKEKQLMDYQYCPTAEMIADMLTKPLGKIKLRGFAEMSGMINF
ncbi:secreted RxLR effector protein 161-like [Nasonia vitripennis]|uniref:Polyprotein n=1 Tax=Nasonia vitripennis TaxID=7425 RepID=A0A7M7Q2L2_NASVI|nr:secreted RxLR effector protein 161-like [Nasonia vitripennis]